MTKNEYRKIYKSKRLALSSLERETLDGGIFNQLKMLDWSDVKSVHVYISMVKFNEPDTLQFVSYLRAEFPSVQIVVSKSDFQQNRMVNYLWDSSVVLEENTWGILEPVGGVRIDAKDIDVVLVPLLVVDTMGNRVGYGKGFYDRFFAECRTDVKKVGLSYFDPVEVISDVGDWDIPLDMVVTSDDIYYFK